MRDWLFIVGGNVVSVVGSISITPENFTAWVASIAGASVTIAVGVSRIRQQRETRLAECAKKLEAQARLDKARYEAVLQADLMCDACIANGKPFKNCGVPEKYCRRKSGGK